MKKRRDHFRNFAKKNYRTRQFENPYFDRKQKKKRLWIIPAAMFLLLGVLATYYTFASPFMLSKIEIRGLARISEQEVRNVIDTHLDRRHFLVIPNRHKTFFQKETLSDLITSNFAFDSTHIEVHNQTIVITVTERLSQIIWKTNNISYYGDLKGVIIQQIPEEQPAPVEQIEEPEEPVLLPLFIDKSNVAVFVGEHVFPETYILNAIDFAEVLTEQGEMIESFIVDRSDLRWIEVKMKDGYIAHIDPNTDVIAQANNLITLLRESIEDIRMVQYVDLRFGDHVYYK